MYLVVCFIVYPYLFLILPVALILLIFLVKFAKLASVESMRLDAISRSPINSFFSATISNLITIRAYRREKIMIDEF